MNKKKTQTICITTAINYQIRSSIEVGGELITSQDTLKVLGFTFGRHPTMQAHIDAIRRKYGARAWFIRHLKKVKLDKKTLTEIYSSLVHPVIEFAAPVYHHMLSDELSEEIERMQRQMFKSIYAMKTSYANAISESGYERLDDRRSSLALKFALKAEKNPRFTHWFHPQLESVYGLRRTQKYAEEFA